ncbi:winged helix-turn-helix domain-containing protein [Haladaptatus pallidirubidus]|uniref:Transcriptional regulator n=1 Tax=Haladaptatus pallidirubidus TaxID=1008152 RepID=A0AAV3UGT6_9EURY|nr:helix-turn-helix domain-containing protein [Haladaptatus pallidirubidus]
MGYTNERGPPKTDFATDFADRLENAPADERVYRIALELTDPTPVSEVADRADCSANAARRHLKRLAEIGLLTRVTENPVTYRRNEAYFKWRRLNRLAELSEQEYKSRLGDLLAENEDYKQTYDVERPDDIDPLEYAEYGDPEQVWLDITNWEAVRQEIHDLRRVNRDSATDEGVV